MKFITRLGRKKVVQLSGFFGLCCCLAAFVYLFRSVRIDHGHSGTVVLKYEWGRLSLQSFDLNQDGSPDFIISYEGLDDEDIEAHPFDGEYWGDRDLNGVFEVHYVQRKGWTVLLEVDLDQDGAMDQHFEGSAAVEELRRLEGKWRGEDAENQLETSADTSCRKN